jgi:hypothetical protein
MQEKMMDNLSHFEFLMLGITLVGGWVKFHGDYNRLSARVQALEDDSTEFKNDVKQLLKDIQEIKLLLAKNQMQ